MGEIITYLSSLVEENKLSQKEFQIFLDYAHDLVLDGYNDEQIESLIKLELEKV